MDGLHPDDLSVMGLDMCAYAIACGQYDSDEPQLTVLMEEVQRFEQEAIHALQLQHVEEQLCSTCITGDKENFDHAVEDFLEIEKVAKILVELRAPQPLPANWQHICQLLPLRGEMANADSTIESQILAIDRKYNKRDKQDNKRKRSIEGGQDYSLQFATTNSSRNTKSSIILRIKEAEEHAEVSKGASGEAPIEEKADEGVEAKAPSEKEKDEGVEATALSEEKEEGGGTHHEVRETARTEMRHYMKNVMLLISKIAVDCLIKAAKTIGMGVFFPIGKVLTFLIDRLKAAFAFIWQYKLYAILLCNVLCRDSSVCGRGFDPAVKMFIDQVQVLHPEFDADTCKLLVISFKNAVCQVFLAVLCSTLNISKLTTKFKGCINQYIDVDAYSAKIPESLKLAFKTATEAIAVLKAFHLNEAELSIDCNSIPVTQRQSGRVEASTTTTHMMRYEDFDQFSQNWWKSVSETIVGDCEKFRDGTLDRSPHKIFAEWFAVVLNTDVRTGGADAPTHQVATAIPNLIRTMAVIVTEQYPVQARYAQVAATMLPVTLDRIRTYCGPFMAGAVKNFPNAPSGRRRRAVGGSIRIGKEMRNRSRQKKRRRFVGGYTKVQSSRVSKPSLFIRTALMDQQRVTRRSNSFSISSTTQN